MQPPASNPTAPRPAPAPVGAAASPILFFDVTCRAPYALRTLAETGLGGTEATAVRIAEALDARVMQHCRSLAEGRYLPPAPASDVRHLVVLRDPHALVELAARYPGARRYLWVHDRMRPGSRRGRRLEACAGELAELAATIVCVSEFQRAQVSEVLRRARLEARVGVVTIYNPVDDTLAPNDAPIDRAKLVFCASPNKGLDFAVDVFRAMRRRIPELRLCVGSPGYKPTHTPLSAAEGIEWLGSLPHARIIEEVRTALAVLHPNFVIPETFGLVLAEARAVGTPVLTHDCGAALEVLGDPGQTLPVKPAQRIYEALARPAPPQLRRGLAAAADALGVFRPYIERVRAWHEGARPSVHPDPRFYRSTVAARWRALFAGELAT